jgi:hypothetical protein
MFVLFFGYPAYPVKKGKWEQTDNYKLEAINYEFWDLNKKRKFFISSFLLIIRKRNFLAWVLVLVVLVLESPPPVRVLVFEHLWFEPRTSQALPNAQTSHLLD